MILVITCELCKQGIIKSRLSCFPARAKVRTLRWKAKNSNMPSSAFFSARPIALPQGVAIVRMIVGALLVYHGVEVFDPQLMNEYMGWEAFAGPNARLLVYTGKSVELIAGLLLLLGLFTRPGALLAMGALSYVTVFVGNGRFWYEDQHPFMFVLFGLLFLFTGPGAWSVDGLLFKEKGKLHNLGLLLFFALSSCAAPKGMPDGNAWFPPHDFDAATFLQAPREYGPFTRWWLPGNDVTEAELRREIKLFAENGFAGVEVQPLVMGLNFNNPPEILDRVFSWDTLSFYEHLRAIMEQAEASGITVDMNGGSGWPLGGAFFDPAESMRTLAVSDTTIPGGARFSGPIPMPAAASEGGAPWIRNNPVDVKWASLLSVTAARFVRESGKQTILDEASIAGLTQIVREGQLDWTAPEGGQWRIIAAWSMPTGEPPSLIASRGASYVIDHLDTAVVNRTYDYLLGPRTGLPAWFKKPLRAVFNDSYEFHTHRMIAPGFLEAFRAGRGYDISPYLACAFQKGYNHPTYLAAFYPGAKPPFAFNESENWRIMYDYDATVNQVFKNNFIKASNAWLNKKGLLHRTQAYGFPIDIIGSSGAADIPEAEQLFAEGSEGYLKLVSSGAHLNNRPVITQESFVSIYRAEMTTPQKIKIWADKSFAAGINQLIYHGTPYKYNNGEYGWEGWNTWSSPYTPTVNFSTGMNESDPFWKDIKSVNQYLTRVQYALRSGRPKTEVLIYMPFIDFTEDQLAVNPEEILYRGYFEGVEPDITGSGVFEAPPTRINTWYKKLWPIVNELESRGVSWEFVNDESLQRALTADGSLRIGENRYQVLILANLPYINLETGKKVNALSKQGLRIWALGDLPRIQPSYKDYEASDALTAQLMQEVARQSTTASGAPQWGWIDQKITYARPMSKIRQITREMRDGSRLRFIWNMSDAWQTIGLAAAGKEFRAAYWIGPESGKITESTGDYGLPPYGSVLFYAATEKAIDKALLSPPAPSFQDAAEILNIENWDIQAGGQAAENSPLFDWREKEQFKFSLGPGIYRSTFNLETKEPAARYLIDLGKVFFTAEVLINNKPAGKRLFAPYMLDITDFVVQGANSIEVRITTARRNAFTGEAAKGNPLYAQFAGREDTLLPSGLLGPVVVKKLKNR